jgi:hypothetical protein
MHQYPGTPHFENDLNSLKGQYFRKSAPQTPRAYKIMANTRKLCRSFIDNHNTSNLQPWFSASVTAATSTDFIDFLNLSLIRIGF